MQAPSKYLRYSAWCFLPLLYYLLTGPFADHSSEFTSSQLQKIQNWAGATPGNRSTDQSPALPRRSGSGCGPSSLPSSGLQAESTGFSYPLLPSLFVFGDSLVDSGNGPRIHGRWSPPPYGTSPGRLYVAQGRASNGFVLSDHLSHLLGLSAQSVPANAPGASWQYGANFAVGGSGASPETGPGALPDQVAAFDGFVRNTTLYWEKQGGSFPALSQYPRPESLGTGLYLIVVGTNDFRVYLESQGSLGEYSVFVANVTASLRFAIESIYALGGRNFVIGTPLNWGCIPYMLHANMGSCSDPVSVSTSQMGSAFEEMLGTLRASLEGATFLTLDIGNVTTIGPSNPAPLGFREASRACCGLGGIANQEHRCGSPLATVCEDPGGHVFWDGLHFTTDFAAQLAREALFGSIFVRPKNILQAFVLPRLEAGLVAQGWRRPEG